MFCPVGGRNCEGEEEEEICQFQAGGLAQKLSMYPKVNSAPVVHWLLLRVL